jgi:hypothetical protein
VLTAGNTEGPHAERVCDKKERGRVYVEGGGSGPSYTPEVEEKRRAVASEGALPEAATLNPNRAPPNPNRPRQTQARRPPQNARPTNRLTVYIYISLNSNNIYLILE